MNTIALTISIISLFSIGLGYFYYVKAKPFAKTSTEKRNLGIMMLMQVLYPLLIVAGAVIYQDSIRALATIIIASVTVYNVIFFMFAESISSIARRTMAAGAWPLFSGDVTTSASAIKVRSGIIAVTSSAVLIYFNV